MPRIYEGLLISTKRNFESNASSEIQYVLKNVLEIDESKFQVKNTGISGLIAVKMSITEYPELMNQLIALEEDKQYFMHCLKIRPIEFIANLSEQSLKEAITNNLSKIKGKYKIEVFKRHATIRSNEVIKALAEEIELPVDLENPDTIILVEIIGDKFGISIIPSEQIYSTKVVFDEKSDSDDNWFLS
ncbi:MAG: THUMP domain-containing protein [Candidatus Heimdallarchaeota archaeon]|nr:THUMP domain-containing protein [Candidatus Heimdallarchaeota archaeon]